VELVAVRVPAEVGQRVDQEDPRVRPEAVLIPLRRRESARAGADHHEVVDVVDVAHVARVDPRRALGGVHVARVREPVDRHHVADDLVPLTGDRHPVEESRVW
jgi:hypothetical protein